MKKNLFSIVGATLTMVAVLTFVYVKNDVNKNNEIFNANVEALADEEEGIKGNCYEIEGLCLYRCNNPECGVLMEAFDHVGPVKKISGVCPQCGREQ